MKEHAIFLVKGSEKSDASPVYPVSGTGFIVEKSKQRHPLISQTNCHCPIASKPVETDIESTWVGLERQEDNSV